VVPFSYLIRTGVDAPYRARTAGAKIAINVS
jgi:hypothetical protein